MWNEVDIFQKRKINFNQLIPYGFIKKENQYIYTQNLLNNTFQVIITIDSHSNIHSQVIDLAFHEEYTNFRIKQQAGDFVTQVREELLAIFNDIKEQCTTPQDFIFPQTNRISQYINNQYHVSPQFPWENDFESGIFRHPDNQKWFALIMNINKKKLNGEDKNIEVINLKLNQEDISHLIQQNGFYPAYHMNKKHWITISLDDTLLDQDIISCIDKSYQLTHPVHEWIIPANLQYYDMFHCFDHDDTMLWKQSTHLYVGDVVYLYITKPYAYILYQCQVLEIDIPYNYHDSHLQINRIMKIKRLKTYQPDEYSLEILKRYGIKTLRGPRRLTPALKNALHQ